jgi:hypothetical protein
VSLPTPSSVYVTSTDGTYSVINKAAGVAKKPGQGKRPVSAKTSKSLEKTLNETNLCYNFVILFQTKDILITIQVLYLYF